MLLVVRVEADAIAVAEMRAGVRVDEITLAAVLARSRIEQVRMAVAATSVPEGALLRVRGRVID